MNYSIHVHAKRAKTNYLLFIKTFVLTERVWRKPRASEILLFNTSGQEFERILEPFSIENVYVDGTETNYYCLFRAMTTFGFWRDPLRSYIKKYSQLTQSRLILTTIDNQPLFYKLSAVVGDTKTMFVQNGRRSNWLDVFETLSLGESFAVDIMCVMGTAIGEKFREFVEGKVEVVGSLRSNFVKLKERNLIESNYILFISSYVRKPIHSETFLKMADGTLISWEGYYLAEKKLFRCISQWCESNGRKLLVCPRLPGANGDEHEHFSSIIYPLKAQFAEKITTSDPYELVDQAEIVVGIDSTLAYEAIGRSKKTAIFSARSSAFGLNYDPFGWPGMYPDQGLFWSNTVSQNEVDRVMNSLLDLTLEKWEQYIEDFRTRLMVFDEANSRIQQLIYSCINS